MLNMCENKVFNLSYTVNGRIDLGVVLIRQGMKFEVTSITFSIRVGSMEKA